MKVSNDIKWFCGQLRKAEQALSEAIEKSEGFSMQDQQILSRIMNEVNMVDLTLLGLLSPK